MVLAAERVTDPATPEEWREAMVLAAVALLIDSAVGYGFITGGPGINQDRCLDILERGRKVPGLEHWPTKDAVDAALAEILPALANAESSS